VRASAAARVTTSETRVRAARYAMKKKMLTL